MIILEVVSIVMFIVFVSSLICYFSHPLDEEL